ncbi:Bro-N domain-containing protein [Schaalia sp. ZJ1691]|uniref:BRO-N domain-containing protein n=1 Tax=Schaalia sp. ZJ1691 TaxID=2709404 RepID=UPI0013ED49C8|nr:Bro-N domain-containing protein [Schaalia sp. ZJ1691]
MSGNLNLYTHPDFGNLRTIIDGETIYICAKDAATALGYANTNKAIKDRCDRNHHTLCTYKQVKAPFSTESFPILLSLVLVYSTGHTTPLLCA